MTLIAQHHRTAQALRLMDLRAPVNVISCETGLGKQPLRRLYHEHTGHPPPRGILPFSLEWFLKWRPNLHSSLFANLYLDLAHGDLDRTERLIVAYQRYLAELNCFDDGAPLLSVARAWTLIRFCRQRMLQLTPCRHCQGHYVTSGYRPSNSFVCGLCNMPSHAGYRHANVLSGRQSLTTAHGNTNTT